MPANWQPIWTAPTNNYSPIILYSPDFTKRQNGCIIACLLQTFDGSLPYSSPYFPCRWTHWMPLPEPREDGCRAIDHYLAGIGE